MSTAVNRLLGDEPLVEGVEAYPAIFLAVSAHVHAGNSERAAMAMVKWIDENRAMIAKPYIRDVVMPILKPYLDTPIEEIRGADIDLKNKLLPESRRDQVERLREQHIVESLEEL